MEDLSLEKLDAVRFAIETATTVQEVKDRLDTLEAAKIYARQKKVGEDIRLSIEEYVVRAERKLGEILKAAKIAGQINKGGRPTEKPVVGDDRLTVKLSDAGINRDLSSRAQKLASIPKNDFESRITEQKTSGKISAKSMTYVKKSEQRSSQPLKEHPREKEFVALFDQGLSVQEIAGQVGNSPHTIRRIIERARLRHDGELQVSRDDLSLSAQEKFDRAIEQEKRRLGAKYRQDVETAAEERYRRRVAKELEELHHEHAIAKRVMMNRRGFMTKKIWRLIRSCLHADWVRDEKQKSRYDDALIEFNKLEKFVLDENESPTKFTDIPEIPSTEEGWEALRRKGEEAKKAAVRAKKENNGAITK